MLLNSIYKMTVKATQSFINKISSSQVTAAAINLFVKKIESKERELLQKRGTGVGIDTKTDIEENTVKGNIDISKTKALADNVILEETKSNLEDEPQEETGKHTPSGKVHPFQQLESSDQSIDGKSWNLKLDGSSNRDLKVILLLYLVTLDK